MAKYLWLNNTVHETPDPEWTMEKALKLQLIPAENKRRSSSSAAMSPIISKETMVSLGSLAFEEGGFSLEK